MPWTTVVHDCATAVFSMNMSLGWRSRNLRSVATRAGLDLMDLPKLLLADAKVLCFLVALSAARIVYATSSTTSAPPAAHQGADCDARYDHKQRNEG